MTKYMILCGDIGQRVVPLRQQLGIDGLISIDMRQEINHIGDPYTQIMQLPIAGDTCLTTTDALMSQIKELQAHMTSLVGQMNAIPDQTTSEYTAISRRLRNAEKQLAVFKQVLQVMTPGLLAMGGMFLPLTMSAYFNRSFVYDRLTVMLDMMTRFAPSPTQHTDIFIVSSMGDDVGQGITQHVARHVRKFFETRFPSICIHFIRLFVWEHGHIRVLQVHLRISQLLLPWPCCMMQH